MYPSQSLALKLPRVMYRTSGVTARKAKPFLEPSKKKGWNMYGEKDNSLVVNVI